MSVCLCLCVAAFLTVRPSHATIVDRIVAVVNDEILTERELEEKSYPILLGMQSPPSEEERVQLRKNILIELVKNKLVNQAAKEKKIVLDRGDVESVVDARMAALQKQYGGEFENVLSEQGYSSDEFRDLLEREIKQEMIKSRLIAQAVESTIVVTDDDIRMLYATRMIVTRSPDDAFKALLQLKSGKLTFEKAARQFSSEGADEGGGDMGTYLLGKWSEEIEAEVIKIKNLGEFSGVIQTDAGFAVVQLVDRRLKPIQEIQPDDRKKIRERLVRLKSAGEANLYVSSLWDRAYVKFVE